MIQSWGHPLVKFVIGWQGAVQKPIMEIEKFAMKAIQFRDNLNIYLHRASGIT